LFQWMMPKRHARGSNMQPQE